MQKSKEATLRISLFKELRMPKVYTLEASFAGPDSGPQAHTHFTTKQLEDMGRDFLLAVLVCNPCKVPREPPLSSSLKSHKARSLRKAVESSRELLAQSPNIFGLEINAESLRNEFLQNDDLRMAGEDACSSDDSDSEPSEDNLEVAKLNKLMPKEARIKQKSLPRANSKKRASIKLQPQPPQSAKKCPECGESASKGHLCNPPQPPPAPAPLPPRKPIGVKTYYNKFGKKVHDQITQTPASFYAKHSLRARRADSLSRAISVEEDSQNFDRRKSTDQTIELSAEIKDTEIFNSALFKPTNSEKWKTPVISARSSINASPTKRALQDRLKQKSIFNSQKQVPPNRGIYSRLAAKSSAERREVL